VSLGLPGAPKIKFLGKGIAKQKKNASRTISALQAEIAKEQAAEKEGVDGSATDAESSSDEDGKEASIDSTHSVSQPLMQKATKVCILPLSFCLRLNSWDQSAIRTKYDRMFERKNNKFEHYTKLVDQNGPSDNEDDFITLKREDHGLSSDTEGQKEDNLSKRKLKMSRSKRAMLKSTDLGKKLVFDDDGNPHELYEMADAEEFFKAGPEGIKDAGKKFAEGERGKLRVADVVDKEEAKEKKREKKRKRKEREMVVSQPFTWS
jgi:ATP-dependent RNA helicase DDX10/DBP4